MKASPDTERVEILSLIPTHAGCAVFLGNGKKCIVFYIDPAIGQSIDIAMSGKKLPRPLTHDLYLQTLEGFGATVSRVIINHANQDIFYARIIVEAKNEIMERKIVELDARPSDCLAIASRTNSPIYVAKDVWDRLEDSSKLLENMQKPADETPPFDFGDFSP